MAEPASDRAILAEDYDATHTEATHALYDLLPKLISTGPAEFPHASDETLKELKQTALFAVGALTRVARLAEAALASNTSKIDENEV